MSEYRAYVTDHLGQFIRAVELGYSDDISAAAAALGAGAEAPARL